MTASNDGSDPSKATMGVCGSRKLASGVHSFRAAGAGSAEVKAVQSARSRTKRSSRMRSLILGMIF